MNMKQLILLTLTFCYSINSFSQVGIGTAEPNASSQLEVKADDKGVLLPQVALQSTTDNNTISNGNVVSLLVCNTNNSDDLKAGYYFWDGSKWMSLGSQSSVSIDVRAHTDSRGLDSFNLALSNRRAKATIKYMIDRGIDPDRITGRGYGELELINNCSDGVVCQDYLHEQNRRSEFIIVKK